MPIALLALTLSAFAIGTSRIIMDDLIHSMT